MYSGASEASPAMVMVLRQLSPAMAGLLAAAFGMHGFLMLMGLAARRRRKVA